MFCLDEAQCYEREEKREDHAFVQLSSALCGVHPGQLETLLMCPIKQKTMRNKIYCKYVSVKEARSNKRNAE